MPRNAIHTVAVVLVTIAVVASMAGAGVAASGPAVQDGGGGVQTAQSTAAVTASAAADAGGNETYTANYSGSAGQGWSATVVEDHDAGTATWTFDPNASVNEALIYIGEPGTAPLPGYFMDQRADGTFTYNQTGIPEAGEELQIRFNGAEPSRYFNHTYGQTDDGGDDQPPSPPAAPTGLSTTGTTDSSVNLTWTHSGENVSEYVVYADGSPTLNTSTTGANVTGLAANTSYEFAVTARNDAGNESSLSGAVTATTESADDGDDPTPSPTPPAAPTNLTETDTTTSSVAVSWDHPGANVSEYVVHVDGSAALNTSTTSANVTGLASNTSYDVSVTAVGDDGLESNASDSVSVTTDALSLPETSLSVAVDDATVGAGNQTELAFDMSAENGTAYGPAIDVALPDGFEIVDRTDANATWNDQETTWLWTSLQAGSTVSPSLTVEAPDSAGNHTVDAVVTATSDAGASDTATLTVEAADDGSGDDGSGGDDGNGSDGGDDGDGSDGGDGDGPNGTETTYNGSDGQGWTATVVEDSDANTATWTFEPEDDVTFTDIHIGEPGADVKPGYGMTAQDDGTYSYTQSGISSGETVDVHFVTDLYVSSSFEHTFGDGSDGGNGSPSPPAAPTELTATSTTSSSVAMSWSHTEPASVDNYVVYVDGEQATQPTETSANVTGLAADTTYELTVAAAAGDVTSANASPISATTDAASTEPAPMSLGVDDATVTAGQQVTVDLPLGATDGDVVAPAVDVSIPDGFEVVDQSGAGGTWNAEESTWLWLALDNGSTVTPSLTLEAPDDTGAYDVGATATDADGAEVTAKGTLTVEAASGGDGDSGGGGDDGGSSGGGGGYAPLPPSDGADEPSFAITDSELQTSTIGVGESLTVSVRVDNDGGADGTFTGNLTAAGERLDTANVSVNQNYHATAEFAASFDEPGSYELLVDGESVGNVTVTGEADLTVTELSLSQTEVAPGDTVTVTGTVENAGSVAGERTVPVTVDGETVASESVSLDAGESTTITVEHAFEASGSQSIAVAGEQVGTVDVQDDESETTSGGDGSEDGDGEQPAPGVFAALIALVVGAIAATRRIGT